LISVQRSDVILPRKRCHPGQRSDVILAKEALSSWPKKRAVILSEPKDLLLTLPCDAGAVCPVVWSGANGSSKKNMIRREERQGQTADPSLTLWMTRVALVAGAVANLRVQASAEVF
jgi:hypothetical protein